MATSQIDSKAQLEDFLAAVREDDLERAGSMLKNHPEYANIRVKGSCWALDPDDPDLPNSGSAYLFDVTTGNELFKLTASDAAEGDNFGHSVTISGNTAIVGAHRVDDSIISLDSGSAYLFDVVTGSELFELTASDAAGGDNFGYSVAISGNTVIVGAYRDGDGGTQSGSSYLFDVTTGHQGDPDVGFEELFKLTASDAAENDFFGGSVAISGNRAIVGASEDNDPFTDSGSAYLFLVPEPGTFGLTGVVMGLIAFRRQRRWSTARLKR